MVEACEVEACEESDAAEPRFESAQGRDEGIGTICFEGGGHRESSRGAIEGEGHPQVHREGHKEFRESSSGGVEVNRRAAVRESIGGWRRHRRPSASAPSKAIHVAIRSGGSAVRE